MYSEDKSAKYYWEYKMFWEEKIYFYILQAKSIQKSTLQSFKDSKKHIKYQLILLTIFINHLIISSTPNIQHPTTLKSYHQHLTSNTLHPTFNTPKIQDNILKNNYITSSKTAINKGKNMDKKQICNKHEIN